MTRRKSKPLRGLSVSRARINPNLPDLPEGWDWYVRNGFYAACLFTWEYDCIVEIQRGSLHLSTGVAPIEIVQAVLKANALSLSTRKPTNR
jgi:hypothetical protein